MTDTANSNPPNLPWYRQFWPWFIILLPATSVVTGITTVVIAFSNSQSLVDDDYYKEGLAINQRLALDEAATAMELEAVISLDKINNGLYVEMSGDFTPPAVLHLLLIHPVDETQDRTLELRRISDKVYRIDMGRLPAQRYYLRIRPASEPNWRLNGEIDFAHNTRVTLRHND